MLSFDDLPVSPCRLIIIRQSRTAIRRADLDEAPRERIAADLGLTANNVGVRLHRARRALKTKLEERCAGCCDGGFRSCDCAGTGEPRRV